MEQNDFAQENCDENKKLLVAESFKQEKHDANYFSNSLVALFDGNLLLASLLQRFHYAFQNETNGTWIKGYRWIWKPVKQLKEEKYSKKSESTIYRAILKLVDWGVLKREQLFKEDNGHNFNPKNRMYYYRVDYEGFAEFEKRRAKEAGCEYIKSDYQNFQNNEQSDRSSSGTTEKPKPKKSKKPTEKPGTQNSEEAEKPSFVINEKPSSFTNEKPSFVTVEKTKQSLHQFSTINTHIEEQECVTESNNLNTEEKAEAREVRSDRQSSNLNSENTFSSVTPSNSKPKVTARVVSENTGVQKTTAVKVKPKYDRSLGIAPLEEQKNVQQRLNGFASGAWLIDGRLDPSFLNWQAEKWMKRWDCDIFTTKQNVLLHFKKDPDNLAIAWEIYREETSQRVNNVGVRLKHGVEIKPEEQKMLIERSRAITEEINPEHRLIADAPILSDSLLSSTNDRLFSLPSCDDDIIMSDLDEVSSSKARAMDAPAAKPVQEEQQRAAFFESDNNLEQPAIFEIDDERCRGNTACHDSEAQQISPPKDKDGFAENPEAYKLYQQQKIENPVDKNMLLQKLGELTKKFSMPKAEPVKPKSTIPQSVAELDNLSLQEVNKLLEDGVLKTALSPILQRSNKFEVFLTEWGHVEYVDYAF